MIRGLLAFALGCRAPTPQGDGPEPIAPQPTAPSPITLSTGHTGHPGAACEAPGCLVAARSLGAFTRSELQALVDPRVRVENGYEVFVIDYLTEGGALATGTVTLPVDALAPPEGWPLVANAHGTVGLDDPCRLSGTVSGAGLAGLFGARGTIGVAPDYPGLGGPGVHRYLDLHDEATSTLDALRAARELAAQHAIPASKRVAVVGLSQGGHAALGVAAWHSRYAPELDLRAIGASGPASGFVEHWRAGVQVPGEHQALHALLMWSFAEASGVDPRPLWAADPADHLLSRCGWDPSFQGARTLYQDFPTRPGEVFSAPFLASYVDGSFEGFDYVAERFAANRVVPWLDDGDQTAPIAIWQGTDDDVVLARDTAELVDALRAGGVEVTLNLVPGGGHVDTAFGFLATAERATDDSVAWVLDQLQAP
jgi:acetyl esterase/lipase